MTGSLVTAQLVAALPLPWQLADRGRRARAIKELAPGPEQRAVALSALEASLAYTVDTKARYGDEPAWGLPWESLDDHWLVLHGTLTEWMPTLADVTREKVRDWAEKNVDAAEIFGATWTAPPDDVVDNIGRMWVSSIVTGAAEDLIRWFRRGARNHLSPSERARVVDLLKEATPRLPWRSTIMTIPVILYLGGPGERDYFDRLANNPGLHEKTRAEAESTRWLTANENFPA